MTETGTAPTELAAQLQRAMRHYNANRHAAALAMLDDIDKEHGVLAEALHLRGLVLFAQGEKDEAIAMIEEAASFLPSHGGVAADLGALLAREGKFEDALVHFQKATDLAPHYGGAWSNLGGALFMLERYREAIPALQKAVELEPTLLDAQRNLGTALQHAQRHKAAVDVFYRALSIDPNDVGVHLALSGALYRAERHDTALHHAQNALELAPGALQAHLHIGNALASLGQIDKAAEHLLKPAAQMPAGLGALSRLIHIRKTKPDSPEFTLLQKVLDRLDTFGADAQARIHFAAGKAYADLGDYDASFEHLGMGNAHTAAEHSIDLKNHVEQVDRMTAVVTPALIKSLGDASGVTEIAPIFVCGMPRSGTTLMEQMLSRHSKVQAGGELNASRVAFGSVRRLINHLEERDTQGITGEDVAQVGEFYAEAVRREGLSGAIITDKLPINYMYVGLLSLALPKARFVIMQRHPLDCCLSNWMQDFGRNQPFSTQFDTLGTVYNQYRRISDHWAALLPDVTKVVPYEDLTRDPETTARAVLDHCGLGWEADVLDHTASSRPVNTASIAQVRQPIYSSSVAKWRAYGPRLAPLARIVAPFLSEEDKAAAGL